MSIHSGYIEIIRKNWAKLFAMSKFKKLNITVPANNNNKKEYENDDDSALEEDELVTCHQQHGRELNGTADQHKAVTQLKKKQNHDSATSVRMSSAGDMI